MHPIPKIKKASIQMPELHVILSNMVTLYMKAKNYHFNTTGPAFYGDHKTYDGIADVALEQFDIIGERMKALQLPTDVLVGCVAECNLLSDKPVKGRDAMIADMLESLELLSEVITKEFMMCDDTTANILQETVAALDKQAYFIRSSK